MERIDGINARLIDLFGIDTISGKPIWRVVWSEHQTEKRKMQTTDTGIQLLYPVVRVVKKYPYIKDRWILERLVVVPPVNADELPESKLSYEPMFVFQHAVTNDYLPPKLEAAKFIIDTVYAAMGKSGLAKYKEDLEEHTPEGKEERIKKLEEELFGDESGLYGKTTPEVGEGIVVPSNYKKEN